MGKTSQKHSAARCRQNGLKDGRMNGHSLFCKRRGTVVHLPLLQRSTGFGRRSDR